MKIGILGASGRLGSVLTEILVGHGHEVAKLGREDADLLDRIEKSLDWIILSVPAHVAIDLIEKFPNINKFIEVGSVKKPIERYKKRLISIHPLFGPRSVNNKKYSNILFIEDISKEGSLEVLNEIFPGYNIIPLTAEKHDKDMVSLLIVPYVLSKISANLNVTNLDYATSSFSIFANLSRMLKDENMEVVMDTIKMNPFSKDILNELDNSILTIKGDLS